MVGFGMFFCTITTANSRVARWSDTHSICLLVFGILAIIAFVAWETFFAPVPLLPFQLLKRRNVIGCCLIALIHPMSGGIVNGYFTTFLYIAVDLDTQTTGYLTGE
jgi:SIT family siderophore-iron:H+ symporter-like MFS transporter